MTTGATRTVLLQNHRGLGAGPHNYYGWWDTGYRQSATNEMSRNHRQTLEPTPATISPTLDAIRRREQNPRRYGGTTHFSSSEANIDESAAAERRRHDRQQTPGAFSLGPSLDTTIRRREESDTPGRAPFAQVRRLAGQLPRPRAVSPDASGDRENNSNHRGNGPHNFYGWGYIRVPTGASRNRDNQQTLETMRVEPTPDSISPTLAAIRRREQFITARVRNNSQQEPEPSSPTLDAIRRREHTGRYRPRSRVPATSVRTQDRDDSSVTMLTFVDQQREIRRELILTSIIHKKVISRKKVSCPPQATTPQDDAEIGAFQVKDECGRLNSNARKNDITVDSEGSTGIGGDCFDNDMLVETAETSLFSPRTCAICCDNYRDGEEIAWSRNENCAHPFHLNCILPWLMDHNDCPMCREKYIEM